MDRLPSQDRGVATIAIILIVAAALALLLVGFLVFTHKAPSPVGWRSAAGVLSEEQTAYLSLLEFTDARMSASKNFLGDTVTYLDVRITNRGAKEIRRLDVELEFVDPFNQVVLREAAHTMTERAPPLKPGESRALHMPFEHMPVDWNQGPPRIKPVYIQF